MQTQWAKECSQAATFLQQMQHRDEGDNFMRARVQSQLESHLTDVSIDESFVEKGLAAMQTQATMRMHQAVAKLPQGKAEVSLSGADASSKTH